MRFWTLVTAFLVESLGQSSMSPDTPELVLNENALEYNATAMDAMILGQTFDNARLTYYDITVGT